MEFMSGNTASLLLRLQNPQLTPYAVWCNCLPFLRRLQSLLRLNIPAGSGILAAYIDAATRGLNYQFPNTITITMYLWIWFILTVIFTVAAMRSS